MKTYEKNLCELGFNEDFVDMTEKHNYKIKMRYN